jgi:hypothetical protein
MRRFCLFDLLEDDLDAPAAFVAGTHAAGCPRRVVRDEDHDAPDGVGIRLAAFRGFEQDWFVVSDFPGGFLRSFFLTLQAILSFARVTQWTPRRLRAKRWRKLM